MLEEIFKQAWAALRRQPVRSCLTMAGIVWGIVAVTMLLAYGSGFRRVLMSTFEVFGHDVILCLPGTTSEQAGGERAGKKVQFERVDIDNLRAGATFAKQVCPETVKFLGITHEERSANTAIRGVCPAYGEMRNEIPSEGRWLNGEDEVNRRRVVFLGAILRRKLFGGRLAVGEIVRIQGMSFTVIGTMSRKFSQMNYFTSDDESAWIPYSVAGDLWDTKSASVIVVTPVAPVLEMKTQQQVLQILAERQHFSPTDNRALRMLSMAEFRPMMLGISYGLEFLLLFVGLLTLGIGGVGVTNIMLVTVDERVREIGLRRALGARRRHIRWQFLAEALALTLTGGAVGIVASILIGKLIGTLPFLGPAYEDTSGRVDIHMQLSWEILAASVALMVVVGVLSGLVPAMRAARLDPVEALRYE
ncbi:MAG TPA: ABC transporter permease [Candidatus Polarisedimenticolia bacterium]|nr:ABC transporter permease [Candidatus Polarisedimenticolia bacterium]